MLSTQDLFEGLTARSLLAVIPFTDVEDVPHTDPLSVLGIDSIECSAPQSFALRGSMMPHSRISRSVAITNSTMCTHMAETTDDDGGQFVNYSDPIVHCAAQNLTSLPWWSSEVLVMFVCVGGGCNI